MERSYYNYHAYSAHTWWERGAFLRSWWRLQADDPYWVPPYYPALRQAIEPGYNPHLARLTPLYLHLEALPRRSSSFTISAPAFEESVAAAVALCDPRRRDAVAYLALLHCANDRDSFNRLFDVAAEQLLARGYRTVVGPTGLSPHLGSGLLQDYWNLIPPLHTPYQPPYLPEIISDSLRPKSRSQLYHLAIPAEPPSPHPGLAQLTRFNPTRLSTDLLLLLVAACPPWGDFAAPDKDEAAFMLRWVSRWPLYGWLAEVNERPVGFILLQPDLASILRQTKGGRHLLWRLWFNWASHKPSQRGRILFAGVLPEWRGQGIGRQLLHQAISTAQQQGWKSLSSGPLPSNAPANKFLKRHGAEPQQTYLLYQKEL